MFYYLKLDNLQHTQYHQLNFHLSWKLPTVADKTQWGLIVGSDKLVNIPTNITIKQLLYCNACDGISSFENDGIGYFLGVADVTPTNIIFRFKENPQTFRWFILSK